MDKNAAVIADVMLINKKKAAEDVTFELPSVAFQTADVAAMGTLSIPLVGLLDDMTMTITKVGVDKGYGTMITPEKLAIDVVNGDGSVTHNGCKAFINAIPQEIPSLSVEIGSSTEAQPTYTVTRYQLVVDGKETLLVDRLNRKLKVNGKDYMSSINKLL